MGTYRILSIDGGGIRGVVAAKLLQQIEEEYLKGSSLHDSFDMFVGTSTGAVIAAAIATGKQPEEILNLYQEQHHKIFSGWYAKVLRHLDIQIHRIKSSLDSHLPDKPKLISKSAHSFLDLIQVIATALVSWRPKYDVKNQALQQVIEDALGVKQPTFKSIRGQGKRLLVTTYDTKQRELFLFDSDEQKFDHTSVSEAVTCSSSAPTFFPAKKFALKKHRCLIDGGVTANNPVAIAIAEAIKTGHTQDGEAISLDTIQVLSIGTGDPTRPIEYSDAKGWGLMQWANRLPDVFFDGASDANHRVADALLPSKNYLRLEMPLMSRAFKGIDFLNDDMDDTRPKNLLNLVSAAEQYFDKFKKNLKIAYSQQLRENSTVDNSIVQADIFDAEVKPEQADFFERLRDETKQRQTTDSFEPSTTEHPFVFAGLGYPVNSQAQKSNSLKRQFIARVTKLRHLPSNVFIVFVAVLLLMGSS